MFDDRCVEEPYLDFYQRNYSQFLKERYLLNGSETVGMFRVQQPEGSFPDDPLSTYSLQLNDAGLVRSRIDLGAGHHNVTLRRGEFVIAPPRTATEYEVFDAHSLLCLGIPESYLNSAAIDLGLEAPDIEPLLRGGHQDPIVRQLVRECWAEANHAERGSLYVDSNLLALAARLLALSAAAQGRQPPAGHPEALSNALFERVREFVDSNLATSLRVSSLAFAVDMGEHQFSRAFRLRVQRTPYQWLIEQRVNKAERLLRETDLPLADIAAETGFSSQSHMTNLFTRRTGISPSELRGKRLSVPAQT